MIAASMTRWVRYWENPSEDCCVVVEITDTAWCEDERGKGWIELTIPTHGSKQDVHLRFNAQQLVDELRRLKVAK